jgi:hypothetical protein
MVDFNPEHLDEFGLTTSEVEFIRLGLESQLGFTERLPEVLDYSDPRQEVYGLLRLEMRRLLDESALHRVPELRGNAWLPKRLARTVIEAVEPGMRATQIEFAELKGMYPFPTQYQAIHIARYNPARQEVIAEEIATSLTGIVS